MAEHDIEKIVEAGGEVFNFRDPTKQPVTDRVTSIRAASSATDTKYPTEKAVADKLLDYALVKKTYGKQGYISYSAADSDILVEKIKLGTLSLYNEGVTVKVYEFDEDDEENAVLVWDSSTLTGNELYQYRNGLQMSNIYISPAGKWVKVSYTGSTYSYIRALGIFMTPKYADSSHVAFAKLRLNDAEYDWNRIATYGSLVTAVVTDSTKTTCDVIFKPESSAVRMRFFGFRCLNTYTGSDAVLLGRSTSALKLYTARKLKTNLARTSDSTFDGSADQLNIPVTGTLPVGSGGTGRTSVTSGNYVVGAGTSALVEKTPKEVGSNVLSSLDDKSNASSYADFVDGDFVVGSDHVNASTISASTFVRRTALNLWNYIKSKLSGSDVNIGGNAATATNATTADTAKAYDPTFSGTNSIASALESKVTEIAFTEGNASAATDLTNVVLCGLKYTGSSLSSGRLSFTLSVTINRGASSKGGILRVDLAIGSDGSIYCKRASLTARSGGLDISEFRLVTGTNGGKPVVGVVWNGTTTSEAYMDVRVIDYMALSASASFVYDAVLSNVSNVVWGSSNAIQSASDSDVVHISGSETITGAKEFSRSGQETNFTDSSGSESIVRARTSTSSNNGSCQLNADRTTHRFGVYGRNENGTSKWVSFVGNDGVVNLGSYGDEVRIGGTKFVFNASQLGTEADTFYWI